MTENRTILILNNQLRLFYGSELHSLHIAEYFRKLGYDVTLAAWDVGDPFVSAAARKGIDVFDIATDNSLFGREYDVVWTHHLTTFFFAHVVNTVAARHHVHGCLSPFLDLENVPISENFDLSARLKILANSVETRDVVRQQVRSEQAVDVFLNVVPDEFFAHRKTDYGEAVRKVVIVSNHVPPELRLAASALGRRGAKVDIIGIDDDHRLVDHRTLLDYDAVVTIGKTVQFALVQGVPVFVYDHFGGPGYLDAASFQRHEDFNFSGRSHREIRSGEDLADTIVNGYPQAVEFARYARNDLAQRYAIESQMGQFGAMLCRRDREPARLLSRIERIGLLKLFHARHQVLFFHFMGLWRSALYNSSRFGWFFRTLRAVCRAFRFPPRRPAPFGSPAE